MTPMTDFNIRQATLKDLDPVVAMAERFVAGTKFSTLGRLDTSRLVRFVSGILQGGGAGYVAELAGGALVGMVAVVRWEHHVCDLVVAEEVALWVEPEHRRSGIGPSLLTIAELWGWNHGADLFKLSAVTETASGGRYCRRLGYELLETSYIKRRGASCLSGGTIP
jgi:GNAT superfamily N-acetyltransferase